MSWERFKPDVFEYSWVKTSSIAWKYNNMSVCLWRFHNRVFIWYSLCEENDLPSTFFTSIIVILWFSRFEKEVKVIIYSNKSHVYIGAFSTDIGHCWKYKTRKFTKNEVSPNVRTRILDTIELWLAPASWRADNRRWHNITPSKSEHECLWIMIRIFGTKIDQECLREGRRVWVRRVRWRERRKEE